MAKNIKVANEVRKTRKKSERETKSKIVEAKITIRR